MVAQGREKAAPNLRDMPGGGVNKAKPPAPLSARDKKIIESLLMGKTESAAGAEFGISRQRVNDIKHTPAALAYMAAWAVTARHETYGMVVYIIRDRLKNAILSGTDYVDWESLVKLVKALEPKEMPDVSAYEFLHAEAERIAEETNLTPEGKAKLLQFVRESA